MGRKAKLRKHRAQAVVEHNPNWLGYTAADFAAYVQDCADRGASEVRLMLTDRRNVAHIREITRGQRYSVPVNVMEVTTKLLMRNG
jgi:azurin